MKSKTNTHAITQDEYDEFFSEDVTIRRKKALAKKIANRLLHFTKVFPDTDIDANCLESSFIFREYDNRQGSNETLVISEIEGNACFYYYGDSEVDGIPVSFLWDDNALNKTLATIKDYENEQREREELEEEHRKSVTREIMTKFTPAQIAFIRANWRFFN